MYCIPTPLDIYFDLCHRCIDTLAMSLLRTPLALTRWTWTRSSYNMVAYQNFCAMPATGQAISKGNLQALNKLPQNSVINRSCTSNSKANAGNDIKDAKASQSSSEKAAKLPEIKSMPPGLTDLVTKTSEAGRWPSLQNISLLALRFVYFESKNCGTEKLILR